MMALSPKSPVKPQQTDIHNWEDQHPGNFVSTQGVTNGMQCRRNRDSISKFEVMPTSQNLELALRRLEITLSYDCFSETVLVAVPGERLTEITDPITAKISRLIERTFGCAYRSLLVKELESLAQEASFDPVLDYFDALKWDGKDRVEFLWVKYANVENSELNRTYGRLFLTALVARQYVPGLKMDEVITLMGPQGNGKSNLCRAITPIELRYFTDQAVIGADGKKTLEQTKGKLICEHAEDFRGRYTDQQRKASLSTTKDRARKAYSRYETERPRRFMFITTTNSDEPIVDPTGARREWLIPTGEEAFEPLSPDIRDQMYAEVRAKYVIPALKGKKGEAERHLALRERVTLPEHLWVEQVKVANEHRAMGEMYYCVKMALSNCHWPTEIKMDELMERLTYVDPALKTKKNAHSKVGSAMKELGFQKLRKNNASKLGKITYYVWKNAQASPAQIYDTVSLDEKLKVPEKIDGLADQI